MRRADRLFQLVQLIRGRRLSTAAYLAERLGVTSRTIYRDVADLQHQGVPIEGEAGVGYRLGAGFDLPPLMFTQGEAKALVAAVRVAQIGLDAGLAAGAKAALSKILSVLPAAARAAAESQAVYAPLNAMTGLDAATRQRLQDLREAVQAQRKVNMTYQDLKDKTSLRVVRPLGCFYWETSGRSLPGARPDKAFATSGWIAFKTVNCWQQVSDRRLEKRWLTFCALWGQRLC